MKKDNTMTQLGLASTKCLCGGTIAASMSGVLAHTYPLCEEFEKAETVKDAADLLERCRIKNSGAARA